MSSRQQIRVFLSSTFVDMQEERDYLVKKIFPSIKAECSRRGVDFVALDLRWGINEEAAKSGKVVEICMDEIVRSRPFFIGLIGGRYGWSPEQGDSAITDRLVAKYPWVEDCVKRGMSITEMEMQFGVLDNPEKINAYFYQKDESVIAGKFKEKKGSPQAKRLEDLKASVKEAADAGKCSLKTYSSMKSLGQYVHDALMDAINRLYPQQIQSRYAAYSLRQEDFLESRRRVYVNYNQPSKFEGKMIVLGEAGSGKSALVANCASNGLPEGSHLVYTVVNNDVNSAEQCVRMLLYELSRQVEGLGVDVLEQPLASPVDLKQVFEKAGFEAKVRWVIDGVDKLELDNDRTATWLNNLPDQISEIVMTMSSVDAVNNAVMKDYTVLKVEELKSGQILEITMRYLKEYSKALSSVQEAHISSSALLKNPRILMVFLEELLQFGVYEELDKFVDSYLSVSTVEGLYLKVLERMDADFGFARMRNVFSYLILSRFGIPEEMLIGLLKVNNIEWVAIYTAVLPFISVCGGYLFMDDAAMSAAVWKHYDISSVQENRRFLKKLETVFEEDNAKLKKQIRSRIRKEDGALMAFLDGIITYFAEKVIGVPYDSLPQEEERYLKNRLSILHLYVSGGMLRRAMKLVVNGAFNSLMNYGSDAYQILRKILLDPHNHPSEFLTLRVAIAAMAIEEAPMLKIYSGFLNFYSDKKRKEKETRRLIRKVMILPIPRKQKVYYRTLLKNEVAGESLEKLLDRESLDGVMTDIIANVAYPFITESESELMRIAEKAAAAADKLKEDTCGTVCCLIASICYMRLGDPKAKEYMLRSVDASINVAVFGPIYNIYGLFEAALTKDADAYQRVCEKVLQHRGNGVAVDLRDACYAALLARPHFAKGGYDDTESLIDEYVDLVRKMDGDIPDFLYKLGRWFKNMKIDYVSYMLFARAASEFDETRYSDRIWANRKASELLSRMYSYEKAYECLQAALSIKLEHMDQTDDISLCDIYDQLETLCRTSQRFADALHWAEEMLKEYQKTDSKEYFCGTYNLISLNFCGMMRDRSLPMPERVGYFYKSYEAACESERWSNKNQLTVVVNRASIVFEAAEQMQQARQLVDEHVKILEKMLSVQGDSGVRSTYLCETLAEGYILVDDWVGLKKLTVEHGLQLKQGFNKALHLLYLGSEDKVKAMKDLMKVFVNEVYGGDSSKAQSYHEEVIQMGLAGQLINALIENAEQEDVLSRLKHYYAAKSLADANGDKTLSDKMLHLMCSVFLNDTSAYRYYDAFNWRVPLEECLKAEGVYGDRLIDLQLQPLLSRLSIASTYVLVEDAFSLAMRASEPMSRIVNIVEVINDLSTVMYTKECLTQLYKYREQTLTLTEAADVELKTRFRDGVGELSKWFLYLERQPEVDDVDCSYDILKYFALPCDSNIVAWKMIQSEGDEELVVRLWEDNPECRLNPYCQAEYLKALEWQGRSEDVVSLCEDFLKDIEDTGGKISVARRYIIALRNLGRYQESLSVLEKYSASLGEENFIHLKDMLLAYTGRLQEALILIERNWDDMCEQEYMKAIILLKQGLLNDAQNAVEGLEVSVDDKYGWTRVLYLIELSRYWKNVGDVAQARECIIPVREYLSKYHMRMCEYEVALLDLD